MESAMDDGSTGPIAADPGRRTVRAMTKTQAHSASRTPTTKTDARADLVPPGTRFSYKEAAILCGRSFATIKRAREAGRFPGAAQDTTTGLKTWLIPVEDLVAAILLPADRVGERVAELEKLRESDKILALRTQIAERDATIARLQAELDAARQEAHRLDAARADSDANLKLALKLAAKAA